MAAPQTLGPFEIISELGRGGMGVVYRARELESGREVALKVVLARLDPYRRARFEREGQLTASLNHVGIVRIHSSGQVDGRPYLAYELVHGKSLSDVMPELPMRRRVEVIRDAARALGYAHEQGVIHRDVKGENILVDEQGHTRVADFGLSTAQDLERLTQTGQMLGTPTHMSPEQVDGRVGVITPASDVWSLGVLLYEALTGVLPFHANTIVEMVGLILGAGYERPRKVAPDVPAPLERICMKALSREPEQRHVDGEALAQDLDAWLEGRWKAQPRRMHGVGVAALLLLGLVGWAVASAVGGESTETPPAAEREPDPKRTSRRRALSQAQLDLARNRLETVEAMPDHRRRAKQAERWLANHRRYPEELRSRAEEMLRKARLEFPLATIDHDPRAGPHRLGVNGFSVRAVFLDEQRLITLGGGALRCWNLDDPVAPPLWEVDAGGKALAAHPGGRWVAASMDPEHLIVDAIDTETRETRRVPGLDPKSNAAVRVEFSGDGSILAVVVRYGGAFLYRWPELKRIQHLEHSAVHDIALSADGALAALAGGPWGDARAPGAVAPYFVAVHRIESGEQILLRTDFERAQTAVAFGSDGATIVVGDRIGELLSIPLADPDRAEAFVARDTSTSVQMARRGRAHNSHIGAIVADGAGRVISSNYTANILGLPLEIRVWELATHKELRLIRTEGGGVVHTLALSPDGSKLALGKGDRSAEVFLTGN